MSQENIQNIISKTGLKPKNSIHYAAYPSKKQVKNAVSGYAAGCNPEDIAAMYDITMFSSGKSGFTFTDKGVYLSGADFLIDKKMRTPQPILYENVQSLRKKDNAIVSIIYKDKHETQIYLGIYEDFFCETFRNILNFLNPKETVKTKKAESAETEEKETETSAGTDSSNESDFDLLEELEIDGHMYYLCSEDEDGEKYAYFFEKTSDGYQCITDEDDLKPLAEAFIAKNPSLTQYFGVEETAEESQAESFVQEMNDGSNVEMTIIESLKKDEHQYLLCTGTYHGEMTPAFYEKKSDGYHCISDDDLINDLAAAFTEKNPSLASLLYDSNEEEKNEDTGKLNITDKDVYDCIVTLKTEDGKDVNFAFLDLITYEGKDYVVLFPEEETDDDGAVIMEIVENTDPESDEECYQPVESQETLQSVFEIFRQRMMNGETSAEKDQEIKTEERPVPYEGNEPYIFISYSHRDTDTVLAIVRQMQNDGFRVWFDDGIDPGSEWDEYIASHLEKCACFIAFMSENYVNSSNCKDEVNYARDLELNRLLIYLDDIKLTGGMAMRLNRLQALYYHKYQIKPMFYRRLYESGVMTDSGTRIVVENN